MEISKHRVTGFDMAMHAMRNPMDSWDKSDSKFEQGWFRIGPNDMQLAVKLIKAGSDHRKFLRLIHIQVFIQLPRYIWTELDTYKVATTRVSCSTMHKLGHRPLTTSDFQDNAVLMQTLVTLNNLGIQYRSTKDVNLLREMKQILPESFLQAATFDFSYETAMNIHHARKNHRMSEWHTICD